MLKSFILLATLFVLQAGAEAEGTTCDACSPECLDCRIRGYTRLTPDQFSADCYLDTVVASDACPSFTDNTAEAIYDPTPVCRQERCTLENGERCKLIGINTSKCNQYVSPANSSLLSNQDGCFTYLTPSPGATNPCPAGSTLLCRYRGIQDSLPNPVPIDLSNPIFSSWSTPVSVNGALRRQRVDTLVEPSPLDYEPCRATEFLEDGTPINLVLEACLSNASAIFTTPYASFLSNYKCQSRHRQPCTDEPTDPARNPVVQGILQGVAGCWQIRPSKGICGPADESALSTPVCFYRIQSKYNDPTKDHCTHPHTP